MGAEVLTDCQFHGIFPNNSSYQAMEQIHHFHQKHLRIDRNANTLLHCMDSIDRSCLVSPHRSFLASFYERRSQFVLAAE